MWRDDSRIDRAYVSPANGKDVNGLILWQNSFECHKCSWIRARDVDGNIIAPFNSKLSSALIETRWKQRFRFTLENETGTDFNDSGQAHSSYFRLQEANNYTLSINGTSIVINHVSGSNNTYSPIWGSILIFIGLQIVYSVSIYFLEKRKQRTIESVEEPKEPVIAKKERLNSLDTFRG